MAMYRASSMKDFFHRIAAVSAFRLKQVRLSVLYGAVGVVIALAWLVSVFAADGNKVQANVPGAATASPSTTLQAEPTNPEGDQATMDTTTPDVSSSTNTSVESTDEGTTVNVNGSEQTVAPGQTFQQTYSSPDGNSKTDISVSGGTTSDSTGQSTSRSVHVHTHSTTESESDAP